MASVKMSTLQTAICQYYNYKSSGRIIGFSYNTYRYIYCILYAILNECLKLITQ